jgi:Lysyl oxidase
MVGTLGVMRALVLLCAVATATLVVVLAVAVSKPAGAATDQLPDLGMDQLTNIQIKKCTDTSGDCAFAGQRQLRFDTKIVNIGAGVFEVYGSRPDTSTPTMSVKQRIYDSAGGHRDVATTAQMYYAGDGHNHWHLKNLESYTLTRLDNGKKVGTGAKEGFCFFDNYPFGSTADRVYSGCAGNQPDALSVTMGLSRGWGDEYSAGTAYQYIDITNLTSGRFRLQATADKHNKHRKHGWFKESNETNNSTWVDIQISGDSVSVIGYGPSAQPISG